MFAALIIRHRGAILATLLLTAAFLFWHAAPSAGAGHPRHHRVHAGETLWGIAASAYPSSDPRQAILDIEQANHLSGPTIQPEEVLLLP